MPLLITGEPGIGKSRLLGELAQRARARGHLVLSGRADEFERDLPYAPFVDAIDDHFGGLDQRTLVAAAGPDAEARLAAVFPSFGTRGAGGTAPEGSQFHVDIERLLGHLAATRPVVLALDDVHWSDDASAAALSALVRGGPPRRVLLALALRTSGIPGPLAEAMSAPDRVKQIALEPLSLADAAELVPADCAGAVYEESGGNPFYLEQLARADRGNAMPPAVLASVAREVAALPAAARVFAHGAAVVGGRFTVELAAHAAGIAPPEAADLAAHLEAAGLSRTASSDQSEFRHPIVRRAVYDSAGSGWRIAAHARLARVLQERGAPLAEVAHHVEQSAQPGDEGAISLLSTSAHEIAADAPAVAAERFAAALRLLPAEVPPARRLELLGPRAAALAAAGLLEPSRETLLEALAQLPPEAIEQRAQFERLCAAVEHLMGRYDDARRRLRDALDALPDRESRAAAALLTELAAHGVWTSDWAAAVAHGTQARAAALAVGDAPRTATAAAFLALGEIGTGAPHRAESLLDEATGGMDGLDDAVLARHLGLPVALAWAHYSADRFDDAIRIGTRGVAVGEAAGGGRFLVATRTAVAAALHRVGGLEEARATIEQALAGARLERYEPGLVLALSISSRIAASIDDGDRARAESDEATAIASRHGSAAVAAGHSYIHAEVLLAGGDARAAMRAALELAGGPDAAPLLPFERCELWCALARAAGDAKAAAAWADRTSDAATPIAKTFAGRARCAALLAAGDPLAAAVAALEAAEAAESVGARLEAARARLDAGLALAAGGDEAQAITLLRGVRADVAACGARGWEAEAVRGLRALGERIGTGGARGHGSSGVEALSGRERTIAEMVADGRTNAEIGATLKIAPRTVETHVANACRKLGVRGRAAVARALSG